MRKPYPRDEVAERFLWNVYRMDSYASSMDCKGEDILLVVPMDPHSIVFSDEKELESVGHHLKGKHDRVVLYMSGITSTKFIRIV